MADPDRARGPGHPGDGGGREPVHGPGERPDVVHLRCGRASGTGLRAVKAVLTQPAGPAAAFRDALARNDLPEFGPGVALALSLSGVFGYRALRGCADAIVAVAGRGAPGAPLFLLVDADLAHSLGGSSRTSCAGRAPSSRWTGSIPASWTSSTSAVRSACPRLAAGHGQVPSVPRVRGAVNRLPRRKCMSDEATGSRGQFFYDDWMAGKKLPVYSGPFRPRSAHHRTRPVGRTRL